MRVLSVDLAHTSSANLGIVILDESEGEFVARRVAPTDLELSRKPSAGELAQQISAFCRLHSVAIVLLDGPQGWRMPDNGLAHSRICERALNTPGKTGLPGAAKPANYLPFIAFSVSVFHELVTEGFDLFKGTSAPQLVVESFPSSAWRTLGLKPLPSKAKAGQADLDRAAGDLRGLFPLRFPDRLSHDELQALVSGLAGVAVARGNPRGYSLAGVAPTLFQGTWREGFIVNPTRDALSPAA